jgi:SAM-dependent methyltransferase
MTTRTNPWLEIPLADYEAHMALPQVAQAELLARTLVAAVDACSPASVAVLGCAGGNGFERFPPTVRRVVGIDVNAAYVAAARERHARNIPGLELHVADIEHDALSIEPVDLAYAALLFEYVDAARALDHILAWIRPGGTLVAVLQMPSDLPEVTPSPFTSLERLAPVMRLLAPQDLAALAAVRGYRLARTEIAAAGGGKRFAVQTFRFDDGGATTEGQFRPEHLRCTSRTISARRTGTRSPISSTRTRSAL